MYTTLNKTSFSRGTTAEKTPERGAAAEREKMLLLSRCETWQLIEWVSAHKDGVSDPLLLRLVSHYRGGGRSERGRRTRYRGSAR